MKNYNNNFWAEWKIYSLGRLVFDSEHLEPGPFDEKWLYFKSLMPTLDHDESVLLDLIAMLNKLEKDGALKLVNSRAYSNYRFEREMRALADSGYPIDVNLSGLSDTIKDKLWNGDTLDYPELVELCYQAPEYAYSDITFQITEIKPEMIKNVTDPYLKLFVADELENQFHSQVVYTYQRHMWGLLNFLSERIPDYGRNQIISAIDVAGIDGDVSSVKFWEFLYSLAMQGYLQVMRIDEDGANIRILNPLIKLVPSNPVFSHKPLGETRDVSLVLQGKSLSLQANNQIIQKIKQFRSENTDGYKVCRQLMDSESPLSRLQLNMKGTTKLKDIPKNIGLSGLIRSKYVEISDNGKQIALHRKLKLSNYEIAEIKTMSTQE